MKACRKASVKDATFHALGHTFLTNARRAGIDGFWIMAITGHKTMSVFKRYNAIDEPGLRQAKTQMTPYVDASAHDSGHPQSQPLENTSCPRSSGG